jgi:16S rRNA G966 N2-methylase RsmD
MIYLWFTDINYYKLTVEKDRDSIFTTITTMHMETRFITLYSGAGCSKVG